MCAMREPSGWWLVAALSCALAVACAGESPVAIGEDAAVPLDARPPTVDARVTLRDGGPPPPPDTGGPLGAPFPIVLAHGFFGFEDFAGVDFVTYFYGVRDGLAARGETQVFTPAVDPFSDSERRGEELLAHVERILAETGRARVNLIGHSQGGLDARYVASVRPDLVESVTTFATPHRGTRIADVVLGLVADGRFQSLVDRLVQILGRPLWDAAGEETSLFASLRQLSTEGMNAFNERHPNQVSVAYYSLTGRTDMHLGGRDCQVDGSPDFVRRYRFTADPVEPLLDIAEQIVDGGAENVVNDGLVRVRDARWGRFLGCVPADHFDEVGQLFGDRPGRGNDFDHRLFYAELIAFLRAAGH